MNLKSIGIFILGVVAGIIVHAATTGTAMDTVSMSERIFIIYNIIITFTTCAIALSVYIGRIKENTISFINNKHFSDGSDILKSKDIATDPKKYASFLDLIQQYESLAIGIKCGIYHERVIKYYLSANISKIKDIIKTTNTIASEYDKKSFDKFQELADKIDKCKY